MIPPKYSSVNKNSNENSTFRIVTGTSNSFIVFPGSSADTGLLRQTSIALMYSRPYTVIQGVVDAFNVSRSQIFIGVTFSF